MDFAHLLVFALALSAVPLLLSAAAGLMGWLHLRGIRQAESLARSPVPTAGTQADAPERLRDGSQLRFISADAGTGLNPAADQILKDALDVTRRVRSAYVVAALSYAALSTAFLVQAAAPARYTAVLIMSYLILAPQIVFLTSSLKMSLRQQLSIALGYSVIGILLALLLSAAGLVVKIPRLLNALIHPPGEWSTFLQTPVGVFVICPLVGLYFLLARRMQPVLAFVAASLLYTGAGVITFYSILSDPSREISIVASVRPWLIPVGLANMVLGLLLAGRLLRLLHRSWPRFGLSTLAVAAVAFAGARMPLRGARSVLAILAGIAGSILIVLFVWVVFKFIVRLQEPGRWLTPQILAAHVGWTSLTLWLLVSVFYLQGRLLSDSNLVFWGCAAALALHLAVLHTLLLKVRSRRLSRAPKRLLLLRTFGRADDSEYLLDALLDTWRRIGAVDLLAARTLRSSMLEALLLRRGADRFLKTDEEVDKRLLDLRSEIDGGVRYPVEGVSCQANVWQRAFTRLAQDAAVVLMDLRGFTAENEGCSWELEYLVKHTPLRRIVLLVDDNKDRLALIERKARRAWAHLPLDSPNTSEQEPALKYLSFNRRSEADGHKLFRLLLGAATDSVAA